MLARSTESVLVEPENSSLGGANNQQHKHPLQDAETSEYQHNGVPGENWAGHERIGKGKIRCDDSQEGDQRPHVSEETATHRQPHSDDGQAFRKIHPLPGGSRSEELRSLPAGLARVPPAHFGGRKPAPRGCRGRQGTRGLLQREISIGVQQFERRHSARGNVPLLSGVREARGSFLATLPPCPPELETPYPAEEERSSCVVHMDSADSGIFAAGALERGHSPAVDGGVLLQVRGGHYPFREETSKFLYRESAPPSSASLPRRPTAEV